MTKTLSIILACMASLSLLSADSAPLINGVPFSISVSGENTTDPGDKISREVKFTNTSGLPIQATISMSVQVDSSFFDGTPPPASGSEMDLPMVGEEVDFIEQDLNLPPKGEQTITLTTNKPLSVGYYFVGIKATASEVTELFYDKQFVLHEKLDELPADSRFGMNSSNPALIDNLRRLGVGWIRFENLKWAFVNPREDYYAYDGSVAPWNVDQDAMVKDYTDAGFNFVGYFFLTPHWATSAPASTPRRRQLNYPPKKNEYYADAVFQTVARFGSEKHPAGVLKTEDKASGKGGLTLLELWNEPNLNNPNWGFWVGTMAEYFEMFRPAAEAARKADPNVMISHASYAGIAPEQVDLLRTYTYADGKTPLDFTDIINVHYYSGKQLPEIATIDPNANRTGAQLEGARTYEENLIDLNAWRNHFKPEAEIWLTETGNDVGGKIGSTLRMQAAKIPRCVMMALAEGIDRVFLYREAGSKPAHHAGAGIITDEGEVRPSWLSMATMIRQLDGAGVNEGIRLPYPNDNVRLYLWNTNQGLVLSAWSVKGEDKVKLGLGNVTKTDAFGHKSKADLNGEWEVTEFPIYLSSISNNSGITKLKNQALAVKEKREQEIEASKDLKAYLFDFGTKDYGGLLQGKGLIRPFIPITSKDEYSASKGYGFTTPGTNDTDDAQKRMLPLLRDQTRFSKKTEFKFNVDAGTYRLEGFAKPSGNNATEAIIKGIQKGEAKFGLLAPQGAEPNFGGTITTTGGPLTLQFSKDINVAWISLIEAK
ncbi:hypothetical protein [Rubellicoccus peritrichatus]|uniref:Uncharacterized protein n=1 Tax=Rubellicoccus peritrichatus TaxID=3080537 RepID=A0AAQ3LCP8_9BACT|nr:hypothetical protein [Puniceicoccus sp. CR14]WOO41470.1 hypothetical protein RZN69_00115 [Puniceicoccus sp. CR14]